MSKTNLTQAIELLGSTLLGKDMMLATAESCTGGLIGAYLTSVAGSSSWFTGGIIAYSNTVKQHVLGVNEEALVSYGAVSAPVVEKMAAGACRLLHTQAAIAVSGVAGPAGGSPLKPVGTVWIGWCVNGLVSSQHFLFEGDRESVRLQTVEQGINGLQLLIKV
ncbi:CinA family protein [Oleidesulfovibrio sp.]|uniref:CinA family protein n=1 Tax=Oleidesulfovibrio sp. TaxID=2909707 RepID=UPI003A8C1437